MYIYIYESPVTPSKFIDYVTVLWPSGLGHRIRVRCARSEHRLRLFHMCPDCLKTKSLRPSRDKQLIPTIARGSRTIKQYVRYAFGMADMWLFHCGPIERSERERERENDPLWAQLRGQAKHKGGIKHPDNNEDSVAAGDFMSVDRPVSANHRHHTVTYRTRFSFEHVRKTIGL